MVDLHWASFQSASTAETTISAELKYCGQLSVKIKSQANAHNNVQRVSFRKTFDSASALPRTSIYILKKRIFSFI